MTNKNWPILAPYTLIIKKLHSYFTNQFSKISRYWPTFWPLVHLKMVTDKRENLLTFSAVAVREELRRYRLSLKRSLCIHSSFSSSRPWRKPTRFLLCLHPSYSHKRNGVGWNYIPHTKIFLGNQTPKKHFTSLPLEFYEVEQGFSDWVHRTQGFHETLLRVLRATELTTCPRNLVRVNPSFKV